MDEWTLEDLAETVSNHLPFDGGSMVSAGPNETIVIVLTAEAAADFVSHLEVDE